MHHDDDIWPDADAAWQVAEEARFSQCLRCRSAPARNIEVPEELAHSPYASPFFCSRRCEHVFFGPGADWAAVYRQEVERYGVGGRRWVQLSSDGPEQWTEDDFVCRGAYLDLPMGREYEPEPRWPPAALPPPGSRRLGRSFRAEGPPPPGVPEPPVTIPAEFRRPDGLQVTPMSFTFPEGSSP